jgi:hypothetical protein
MKLRYLQITLTSALKTQSKFRFKVTAKAGYFRGHRGDVALQQEF